LEFADLSVDFCSKNLSAVALFWRLNLVRELKSQSWICWMFTA